MILHIDMDAFYASVEERDRPELVGKPVIVGGSPQSRGVVAAANYVVRTFGVHSAMPTSTAMRLCPHAILIPPRIHYYAEVSAQIREILDHYSPLVEPLSLDEAFMDVTGCDSLWGSPLQIAQAIKQEIREKLQLIASVGVAPNMFLAKIASDLRKPDALVVVDPDRVQEFLDPLPVGRLWGVGRVTGQALEQLGIRTIGQVRQMSPATLLQHFGKSGEHFHQLASGIDERRVVPDRDAKSVSHETTFAVDLDDRDVLRAWILELAEQVGWRLRRCHLRGRTIQIKVRFANFQTIVRSRTLPQSTETTREIQQTAMKLLEETLSVPHQRIRLLGVGVSHFEPPRQIQQTLFDEEDDHEKQQQLDQTTDQIRARFGSAALLRASGLMHGAEHQPDPRTTKKKPDSDRG